MQVSWYDDGVLELESGVSEGDRIATAGSFKLLDNELVRVKRLQPAPKTPSMSNAEPTEQLVGMVR